MMVIVDYLHDTANPQTDWLDLELGHDPIGLTNLILCEVLQGIRYERRFRIAEQMLTALPVLDIAGSGLAIEAARNFRHLRNMGITVRKTVDCLIATYCIQEGHRLLHRDRDFDAFEQHLGLRVVKA
jgi:predicted nucleic acid-binding protein